ncbi:hypothetical protein [Agromyces sp. NPDC058064]|uniref:hypothetical protein n=1 Tax=Agromyces sp. NPDC058064 TaxID=3346322 RepID=UPI0036DB02AF
MSAETEPKSRWQQVKALVLTAGGLAGAILAVVGVWNLFFSPDEGEQVSLELEQLEDQKLHDFDFDEASRGLTSASGPAVEEMGPGQASVELTVVAVPSPAPDKVTGGSTDEVTDGGTDEVTDDSTDAPETGDPTDPAEDPTDMPTVAPTPSTTPDVSDSPSASTRRFDAVPNTDVLNEVAQNPVLDKWDPTDDEVKAVMRAIAENIDLRDPSGDALSADDAATQLAAAFEEVESSEEGGRLNPHGYRVRVDYQLDWLAGEPLVLTWSVRSDDASAWTSDRLGVRFTPTKEHDGGTAYIWAPDLESAGRHTLDVKIYHLPDETLLKGGSLDLPPD